MVNFAGRDNSARIQLFELALPFLGGRLWNEDEEGVRSDASWYSYVVGRLREYRSATMPLRAAIARCQTESDYLRLARDVESVLTEALVRFGLHRPQPSSTERDLIEGVASVAATAAGLPQMKSLWLVTRSLLYRVRPPGERHVRFVYREIVQAWQDSGR